MHIENVHSKRKPLKASRIWKVLHRDSKIEAQLLKFLILVYFVLNATYVTMSKMVIISATIFVKFYCS